MNFYGQETGGDGDVRNAYKLHENGKKAAEYLASSKIIGKYSGSRKANLFALRKSVLKMELDLSFGTTMLKRSFASQRRKFDRCKPCRRPKGC